MESQERPPKKNGKTELAVSMESQERPPKKNGKTELAVSDSLANISAELAKVLKALNSESQVGGAPCKVDSDCPKSHYCSPQGMGCLFHASPYLENEKSVAGYVADAEAYGKEALDYWASHRENEKSVAGMWEDSEDYAKKMWNDYEHPKNEKSVAGYVADAEAYGKKWLDNWASHQENEKSVAGMWEDSEDYAKKMWNDYEHPKSAKEKALAAQNSVLQKQNQVLVKALLEATAAKETAIGFKSHRIGRRKL